MKRLQYSIYRRETGNASGKAKKDAFDIALRMGFTPHYNPSSRQFIRIFQQIVRLPVFLGKKIIFFQYPAVSEQLMRLFGRIISSESYTIALIHDLSSIQGLITLEQKREAECLNIFDCIIVHNEQMEKYVRAIGYRGKVVVLELFDYLHDAAHPISDKPFSNSISFAGNLEKAKFLQDLGKISRCNWVLYGITGNSDFSTIPNVYYQGLLPSDEIQYLMEGDYGLVWDGDSIETCAGPNGEYLRYNNPHKLSCCIAAGKPVITWKKAAIADFVKKYQVGITVESLEELNNIDLSCGFDEMKQNVLKLKKEVAEGRFLERAIKRALELEGKK